MTGSVDSSEAKRFWLCPLYSFDAYSENVELDEGIQIKSFSVLPGLSDYIQRQSHDLYGRWDDPSEYNGVILLPYHAKTLGSSGIETLKTALEEQDRAADLLVDLVTSLRLCHKGEITAGPLISAAISNSQWSFGGSTIWTLVSQRDFLHNEPKYVLQQSDVPNVNELVGNLAKLRQLEKLDAINIALRRFNSAYDGYIEDRLIDQMIAFESLYLEDIQELTYKLALRVAFLLGKRGNKRKTIFDNMKAAYRYRSKIVHGGKQVSRKELRGIIAKTGDYLRQSIRRFLQLLSQGNSLKEIQDKLDENILNNGRILAFKE